MTAPKSILLVEDDKDDQEFFIEALSEIENTTLYFVANNGREAVDRLEKAVTLPDLIFMDINMPVMNGIESLKEMTKNPQLNKIPVVILSSDSGKIEIAHELGVKAFIKKPADKKLFRDQLEKMINLDFTDDGPAANQTYQSLDSSLKIVR